MRPYNEGESLLNIIQTAIPGFVATEYPLFVEFVKSFLLFLEQKREMQTTTIYPEYAPNTAIQATATVGGPVYEARKLLEYRDISTSLDEFTTHFLSMFAKNFPQHAHIPADLLVRSLRQFYQSKGTSESIQWFFRAFFDKDAQVYFPRTDILRCSDGRWSANTTLKVSTPLFGLNFDVEKYYVGQRIVTETGSALVESVTTDILGEAYGAHVVVNELVLKSNSILGTFAFGQDVYNTDSNTVVHTTILPIISGVNVNSGGSNYAIGDEVLFSEGPGEGEGYGASGVVAVVSNTALNGVRVLDGGDGFVKGLPVLFTSTSGSGASAVIDSVVYGEFAMEDGGYLTNEDQSGDSYRLVLEDCNTLILELMIEPFTNAISNVHINDSDYGTKASVAQMVGANIDSQMAVALAAVDEKPFMHPWVFTDVMEANAALANVAALVSLTCNAFFSNGISVYSITSLQDVTTNTGTAQFTANVIVSDVSVGNTQNMLYLKQLVGAGYLQPGTLIKQTGGGTAQDGTVSVDGSANVVGNGTVFTHTVKTNAHMKIAGNTEVVVKSVVNNTFLTTYANVGFSLSNTTYATIAVGTAAELTWQSQQNYGKIKTIRLITTGQHYATPPAVSVDSVSARAQEKWHLNPDLANTANSQIVASQGVSLFLAAILQALQDSGQITKVTIIDSGVNYTDANSTLITAIHGGGRTGTDAIMSPILGALTKYAGHYTSNNGFLSADKYLQDSEYYNDYTYVVRVDETFDRYKELLLRILHPAGFRVLGEDTSV